MSAIGGIAEDTTSSHELLQHLLGTKIVFFQPEFTGRLAWNAERYINPFGCFVTLNLLYDKRSEIIAEREWSSDWSGVIWSPLLNDPRIFVNVYIEFNVVKEIKLGEERF